MTLRSKVLPFLLTALLVAPACSSDDDDDGGTGPTGDELTTVEFESMVEAMLTLNSLGFGGLVGFNPASSTALAAQTGSTLTYSASPACPNGGTTGVSATYTVNPDGTQLTGTVTQTYSNCQAQSTNGTTWTFNGDPNVVFSFTFTSTDDQSYTMTATQIGGIAWGGAGKGGNCSMNLNLSNTTTVVGQSYTFNYSLNGTMCGQTVNETFSFTA